MIKKIFAFSLILFGSFLEIYYYAFRFTNDGIPAWLAVIIGVALTIFLSALVYFGSQNRFLYILAGLIAIYSVLATSAGQSFSLGTVSEAKAVTQSEQANIQDQIKYYRDNINLLRQEYLQNQEVLVSGGSLQDLAWFRQTSLTMIDRQEEIQAQITEYETSINALLNDSTTHNDVEIQNESNIYIFYADITEWEADWLQFILQTVLSFFIALMSPAGMIILRDPKKSAVTDNDIRDWVWLNWKNVRDKKSQHIIPEAVFFSYMNTKGRDFPKKLYDTILNAAIKAKTIDKNLIIVDNEIEVREKIRRVLK